jgi:quinol monooxygenase YgiN
MTAINVVRFRVKPGREADFIDAHRRVRRDWAGSRRFSVIRTGERTFCVIGEWDDMHALATARPQMIAVLDSFRDALEDLGGGIGVTDAVSGEVILEL